MPQWNTEGENPDYESLSYEDAYAELIRLRFTEDQANEMFNSLSETRRENTKLRPGSDSPNTFAHYVTLKCIDGQHYTVDAG